MGSLANGAESQGQLRHDGFRRGSSGRYIVFRSAIILMRQPDGLSQANRKCEQIVRCEGFLRPAILHIRNMAPFAATANTETISAVLVPPE